MAKQTITVQQMTGNVDFSAKDTLFVIVGDLDLGGNTVMFDSSSVVLFRGGSFSNGTLSGVFHFEAPSYPIFIDKGTEVLNFHKDIKMDVPYLNPVWFGAHADGVTDDVVAINKAIQVAEKVSIKCILFCGDYYVSEPIVISKGNLWLRGSGALLREEQFLVTFDKDDQQKTTYTELAEGDEWPISRTSTIYCNRDSDCISVTELVSESIHISDLQFCSVITDDKTGTRKRQDFKNSGIFYKSEFTGPTWPVIIERCYFYGFNKAIYIASMLSYCIHCLQITDCAFKNNNYCLDSVSHPAKDGDPTLDLSWSFIFENNRCHYNGTVLRFGVEKGLCRIENNNCEGTLGFSKKEKAKDTSKDGDTSKVQDTQDTPQTQDSPKDGEDKDSPEKKEVQYYAIDLEIGQRAHAVIQHNHFEVNKTRLVRVIGCYDTDSMVTATNNNVDGVDAAYNWSCFENVVLNTDLQSEVNSCFFEKELDDRRTYKPSLKEGRSTALLKDFGVWYWDFDKNPVMVVDKGYSDFTLKDKNGVTNPTIEWVETPLGRRKMAKYVHQEDVNFINIFGKPFAYRWNGKNNYLNMEIPFFMKGSNVVNLDCYLRAIYSGASNNDVYSNFGPIMTFCKKGMFRFRITGKLWDTLNTSIDESDKNKCVSIYFHFGISNPTALGSTESIWLGPASVIFTDEPIPLNYSIIKNIDMPE